MTRVTTRRRRSLPDASYASLCAVQAAQLRPASRATKDARAEQQACGCCQTQASPVFSSVENFVSPCPASTQIFRGTDAMLAPPRNGVNEHTYG